MSQQLLDLGTGPDSGDGDPGRVGGQKINENFSDLYAIKGEITYTPINQSAYTITYDELIVGVNVFGVNYNGAVSVLLPSFVESNKFIVINDESGTVVANPITIGVA